MVSCNIRASLRNLYINATISLVIILYAALQEFLLATVATPKLEQLLSGAFIALLIAWVLFLGHCCGELVLELRRSNYHYLWSLLPFLLPVIIYASQNAIARWIVS